jgi:LemA protein
MKLIIIMLIIILIALWVLITYNKFTQLKTIQIDTFKTINDLLKKRYALIPVYIELSKTYIRDPNLTTTLMELRSTSMGATTIAEKAGAEAELYRTLTMIDTAIKHHRASDPDLVAISQELADIEATLQQTIHAHNDAAAHFNVLVDSFPTKLIAMLAHFEPVAYF